MIQGPWNKVFLLTENSGDIFKIVVMVVSILMKTCPEKKEKGLLEYLFYFLNQLGLEGFIFDYFFPQVPKCLLHLLSRV